MFDKKFLEDNPGRKPITQRLSENTKVCDNGCHEYTGGKDSHGYGRISVGGHRLGAHKISYLVNVGDFDQVKHELLHSCDNRACINPAHLSPGTHQENIQDCIDKGRFIFNGGNRVAVRNQAIANGEATYHGSACEKHGTTLRSSVNGSCMECREDYKTAKKRQRADAGRNWQWS